MKYLQEFHFHNFSIHQHCLEAPWFSIDFVVRCWGLPQTSRQFFLWPLGPSIVAAKLHVMLRIHWILNRLHGDFPRTSKPMIRSDGSTLGGEFLKWSEGSFDPVVGKLIIHRSWVNLTHLQPTLYHLQPTLFRNPTVASQIYSQKSRRKPAAAWRSPGPKWPFLFISPPSTRSLCALAILEKILDPPKGAAWKKSMYKDQLVISSPVLQKNLLVTPWIFPEPSNERHFLTRRIFTCICISLQIFAYIHILFMQSYIYLHTVIYIYKYTYGPYGCVSKLGELYSNGFLLKDMCQGLESQNWEWLFHL